MTDRIRLTGTAPSAVAGLNLGDDLTLTVAATVTRLGVEGPAAAPHRFAAARALDVTVEAARPGPGHHRRRPRPPAAAGRWTLDRVHEAGVPVLIPAVTHPEAPLRVAYYRGSGGEGRHTVTYAGRTLDVRPDGITSTANRSRIINSALAQLGSPADPDRPFDPLTYIAGALALNGAANLELVEQEPR